MSLDPLVGTDNARTPLRSKVLAVPSLRKRYLQHMKTIAEEWLDWKKLGPVVARYRSLVEKEVEADTRKLGSLEDFQRITADAADTASQGRRGQWNLHAFADARRSFLLEHAEIKKATSPEEPAAK